MSNRTVLAVLTAALLALALVGCGGKKAAPAGGSAAMPPECAKYVKRIEACKANLKNGAKFEMKFDDPRFLQSAEACTEADKMFGDLVKETGCES